MPYIETPEDLAEHLADQIGIYGICENEDHIDCGCRIEFVGPMADRIRQSVKNEKRISRNRIQNIINSAREKDSEQALQMIKYLPEIVEMHLDDVVRDLLKDTQLPDWAVQDLLDELEDYIHSN